MPSHNDRRAVLFALSAVLLWSTASTAFKLALVQLSVVQLLLVASYSSLVAIAGVLWWQGQWRSLWPISLPHLGLSALLGLLNPLCYYLVLLSAYDRLPAQIAQPLNYTWPLVLVFLSAPILKQRIAGRSYIALFVSFVGVIIISLRGHFGTWPQGDGWGIFLASSSALIWASFWLINQLDPRSELVKLFYNFLFGSMFVTLIAIPTGDIFVPLSKGLLAGVYVGWFEMGFTFVLWMKAMSHASSTDKIGNLVYLSPFLALLFIAGVLQEAILPSTIWGLLFIVGGIFIQKGWPSTAVIRATARHIGRSRP